MTTMSHGESVREAFLDKAANAATEELREAWLDRAEEATEAFGLEGATAHSGASWKSPSFAPCATCGTLCEIVETVNGRWKCPCGTWNA